jgi:predicted Zn-dependent peptidase
MRRLAAFFSVWLLITALALGVAAEPAMDINIDVKSFELDNGMLFLVVQRPATPQVAVRLAIRAGSAMEQTGKTGIAHMLEHMMFKGTKNFGTTDVEKDRQLQTQIEAAYQTVLSEQRKRRPDPEIIRRKLAEMEALRTEVQKIYIPQALSAQLGKNGAVQINAFTTKDQTQYTASVPADMLEQWFSIISEQIFEPSWREFYVEKEVVQREWAFRYVNNPDGAAWLDLDASAYVAHPYRNPVIGWKADMETFNTTDAIAFHRRYYNPTNAVCVLVGDLTVADARRLADIYFARYPAGPRSPETVTAEPTQQGPRTSIRYLKGARTPLLRIGYHGTAMGTDDFYALDALTMVLSQGRSARLTRDLVNRGRAVEAWAYNPDNRYGGMVVLGGSPNDPASLGDADVSQDDRQKAYLEACRKLELDLLAELERLQTGLVTAVELQRIKKLNERDFLERMRSNESLAGALATMEVQVGWSYLNTYLRRMAAVTPEDIQRVAQKYLRPENRTSVFVIPGGPPDEPPTAYREVRMASGPAATGPHRPVSFDNHSVYPTPAGWKHPLSFERQPAVIAYPPPQTAHVGKTELFFIKDAELPLISMTLLVKAGAVDVDPGQTGLAALINKSLITGGTVGYAPEELARTLDQNAIDVAVSVGEEFTTIRLSVLKDDWQKGLALLEEIVTRPAFRADVLAVAKQQEAIALQRQGDDAQAVAMREAMMWHFRGHPYGRDPLRALETLGGITGDDLKAFLRTYVVPSNLVAAVSGDIQREAAVAGLRRFLQALPDGPAPRRRLTDPPASSPLITLVDKPGQVQSQVVMALPGSRRSNPDYWKLRLLTDIFGGNDSLMYTRLRDELGLVYAAGFYQTYKWQAGLLLGYIGCKADSTALSIAETVTIMQALQQEIPADQLERKRLEALNSFVFNVDTPEALANVYAQYALRGEPMNTLEKIQEAYIDATADQLHRLAETYLVPERLQVTVVADKTLLVESDGGGSRTLEAALQRLATQLVLPYREIKLR